MNLLALGLIPEHITDIRRFTGYSGQTRISNYCGYARDFISQVIEEEDLDGALMPYSCDSIRAAADYLADCGKFVYQLKVPILTGDAAVSFLAEMIMDMHLRICGYFGIEITTDEILWRCDLINRRNSKLARIYDDIASYSYYEYISGINKMLSVPLEEWECYIPKTPAKTGEGKKIYIIGSFMTNTEIIKQIEKCGFTVAGDNLSNSKRLFYSAGEIRENSLYSDIARSLLSNPPSPTQSAFGKTVQSDITEIKRKEIKGVLYICQKNCEPYDFIFQSYKIALEGLGIPLMRVYLADSNDGIRLDTLESFYEII